MVQRTSEVSGKKEIIEEEVGNLALFKLSLFQTVCENITLFYKDCLFLMFQNLVWSPSPAPWGSTRRPRWHWED